jgi:hypothetical protein
MVGLASGRIPFDIAATARNHRSISMDHLPAHAITGCDTVSQLFGIRKAI